MAYDKPLPIKDADSAPYWDGARRHKLMIQHCRETDQYFLYSRQLTPGVDDKQVEWVEAKGTGTVYS